MHLWLIINVVLLLVPCIISKFSSEWTKSSLHHASLCSTRPSASWLPDSPPETHATTRGGAKVRCANVSRRPMPSSNRPRPAATATNSLKDRSAKSMRRYRSKLRGKVWQLTQILRETGAFSSEPDSNEDVCIEDALERALMFLTQYKIYWQSSAVASHIAA